MDSRGMSLATVKYVPRGWTWVVPVRREPISKSCEITKADNLNRRRGLSRKAQ